MAKQLQVKALCWSHVVRDETGLNKSFLQKLCRRSDLLDGRVKIKQPPLCNHVLPTASNIYSLRENILSNTTFSATWFLPGITL